MKEKYTPTIGLEVHAQLKTKTKMFCNSKNDPDEERPNVNICPVCMGHPGTLPVINKEAVRHVLRVGVAVEGELADFTEFDRKNYFYPDIPKGYQISQYKYPLVRGGKLAGVELTRIHLEEDTARSIHEGEESIVDFNRAGIPLMELVTEPVIHSADEAVRFARELQLLLRYLGAGDANMEKGEMRVEANISVSKDDSLGTKVEVKNLNSFKVVESAIELEVERQIDLLERGEEVSQETRGWDESKQNTFSQRRKEESHDYRYFPDPDIPKLKISEIETFEKSVILENLPELPDEKRKRYEKTLSVKDTGIDIFLVNPQLGDFFDKVINLLENNDDIKNAEEAIKLSANYLTSDVIGMMEEKGDLGGLEAESFARLIEMIQLDELSSRGAKDTLAILYAEGGDPKEIAEKEDLIQSSDEGELLQLAQEVIEENPEAVEEYKGGKEAALKYLMGQGMRKSGGSANPEVLEQLLHKELKK
ncbi:MAG: Asp-tRNA(Asn)/Glu-tRNA(Gln) amidotransferase subunit GatB [Candidatus Paceibacterota bacterium]